MIYFDASNIKKWIYSKETYDFEKKKQPNLVVNSLLIEALNLEIYANVTIVLKHRVVRINSVSLSRVSAYFRTMLNGKFFEKNKKNIELQIRCDDHSEYKDLNALSEYALSGFVKHADFERISGFFCVDNYFTALKKIDTDPPPNFIFIEVEGTGRVDRDETSNSRIVSLNAYAPKTKTNKYFMSFVNPGINIPEQIVAMHGIRNEDVMHAPSFRDVWKNFQKWIEESHNQKSITLVGYNFYAYDLSLINLELKREGLRTVHMQTLDTSQLVNYFFKAVNKHPFSALREHLNIPESTNNCSLYNNWQILEKFLGGIPNAKIKKALASHRPISTLVNLIKTQGYLSIPTKEASLSSISKKRIATDTE